MNTDPIVKIEKKGQRFFFKDEIITYRTNKKRIDPTHPTLPKLVV